MGKETLRRYADRRKKSTCRGKKLVPCRRAAPTCKYAHGVQRKYCRKSKSRRLTRYYSA